MRRACVIGWPIEHSRSPSIHGYWLKHYKIDGEYRAETVRPEDLAAFLGSLAKTYVGANVTLPHKEEALRFADSVDVSGASDRCSQYALAGRGRQASCEQHGCVWLHDQSRAASAGMER